MLMCLDFDCFQSLKIQLIFKSKLGGSWGSSLGTIGKPFFLWVHQGGIVVCRPMVWEWSY
jgi:hypothetical protein